MKSLVPPPSRTLSQQVHWTPILGYEDTTRTPRKPLQQCLSLMTRGVTTAPLQKLIAITSSTDTKTHYFHVRSHYNTFKSWEASLSAPSRTKPHHFQHVQGLGCVKPKLKYLIPYRAPTHSVPVSAARRKRGNSFPLMCPSFIGCDSDSMVVAIKGQLQS